MIRSPDENIDFSQSLSGVQENLHNSSPLLCLTDLVGTDVSAMTSDDISKGAQQGTDKISF